MSGITEWSCKVEEIGPDGYAAERTATAAERADLTEKLEVDALDALSATVVIKAVGGSGRYRMTGRVRAAVTQACVVTLDPVSSSIDEEIDVAFCPPEQIGPLAEGEHSVLEADVPEEIENGRIDIGRVVYETLSAGIDPYPRKAGAEIESGVVEVGKADSRPESPFAVLARLKKP